MSMSSEHREAIDAIKNYYSGKVQHAENASKEYAQLALRSVITLNAGVAIAYPAIVEVFVEQTSFTMVLWPTVLAVLGATLGVICSYITYFNHNFAASSEHANMQLEILEADAFFDDSTRYRFAQWRTETKEFWLTHIKATNTHRNRSFYTSNAIGVAALLCFVASVVWFALVVRPV